MHGVQKKVLQVHRGRSFASKGGSRNLGPTWRAWWLTAAEPQRCDSSKSSTASWSCFTVHSCWQPRSWSQDDNAQVQRKSKAVATAKTSKSKIRRFPTRLSRLPVTWLYMSSQGKIAGTWIGTYFLSCSLGWSWNPGRHCPEVLAPLQLWLFSSAISSDLPHRDPFKSLGCPRKYMETPSQGSWIRWSCTSADVDAMGEDMLIWPVTTTLWLKLILGASYFEDPVTFNTKKKLGCTNVVFVETFTVLHLFTEISVLLTF